MDGSDYMPLFLAEAREHLQDLNLAVVKIEDSPEDQETVDQIFRIAHSLKGMSATMGFEGMAHLTHEMEDVFELLRQRSGGLSRDAIDVLLQCLDALQAAVDSIDSTGTEQIAPEPLADRLRGLVRARTEEQEAAAEIVTAPSPGLLVAKAAGRPILHAVIKLAEDTAMPSVRAFMALAALGDHGEVLASVPSAEAVDGFAGHQVEAWLATEHDPDPVIASVAAVPDVAEVTAAEHRPDAADQPSEPLKASAPAARREATAPGGQRGSDTVRVNAERLDQLMHYMGELVVHRTEVESIVEGAGIPGLQQAVQNLTRASQALQQMVMQVRMIPVEAVLLRFPRLVRDLSSTLGKQTELVLVGKETELDRTVVDALGGPLVHLVRNALDHGLEPPDVREAASKPTLGTLQIAARHAGGNVEITVRDDGAGISPELVARKALERGLISEEAATAIDMAQAAELLFAPGFSTAEQTSEVSGRGVGMDAVRTTLRELGGDVTLESERGVGTTAQIRLPLTLAIVSALLIEVGGQPFAIPLDRVDRTIRLSDHVVRSVAGAPRLVMGDGSIPLLDAGVALGAGPTEFDHAVLVHGVNDGLALGVGHLVGQRELVTRPLPAAAAGAALSGGAVLPNGEIALIVDCDALKATGNAALVPQATAA